MWFDCKVKGDWSGLLVKNLTLCSRADVSNTSSKANYPWPNFTDFSQQNFKPDHYRFLPPTLQYIIN